MSKPKTPMTDLFVGDKWRIDFGAGYGGEVYHGYVLNQGIWVSFCGRERWRRRIVGPVTAYEERDISPVRRPCKRCLAALRRAQKEAKTK